MQLSEQEQQLAKDAFRQAMRGLSEQIQQDIISYFDHPARERHVNPTGDVSVDELCQIVVDQFNEFGSQMEAHDAD